MAKFNIVNPYNNKILQEKHYHSLELAYKKVVDLDSAYRIWHNNSFQDRANLIQAFRDFLELSKHDLAKLITSDMGKPIIESESELDKSIECCDFYIANIALISKRMNLEYGIREPIGVVMGIMPWNYPLWQVIRFLIPTLIIGNTCLIKPAFNTYRITEFINKFFQRQNIQVVDALIIEDSDVEKIIECQNISAVSLTGSIKAGRRVGGIVGKNLKPCILELGGSDPYIVFSDSDIDMAITSAMRSRFLNSGQTCIAAKRFYFQQDIFSKSLELFVAKANKYLKYGDPYDRDTTLGPMARRDIKLGLEDQIKRANINSSQILYKGPAISGDGNYFAPMIIDASELDNENPLLKEEVFGPVAVCMPFEDYDDVIMKANQTEFGLGASIWTQDPIIQKQVISDIDSGIVAINSMVKSDPAQPFGGRKNSGIGIELGIDGAMSFTNYKTIITG
ncbi:MAG: aldehyde dehydrogenase family protein [Rickettsiales bacterium]|nr:aldehyde dehydrogenase family protein [Rickettsiales bacterium]